MPPDREHGRNPGERDDGLEQELRDLGTHLDYPPTPGLARATRSRLEDEAERTSRRGGFLASLPSRRWVAVAAVFLALALPVLSPGVRSAVSGFFTTGMGAGGSAAQGGGGGSGGYRVTTESGERAAGGTAGATGGGETSASAASGAQATKDMAATAAPSSGGAGDEDLAGSAGGGGGSMAGSAGGGAPKVRRVPEVVGMRVAAACGKLSSRGFAGYLVEAVDRTDAGPGRVVSQRPEAGSRRSKGDNVDLRVSRPFSAGDLRGSRRGGPGCVDATQ